MSRPVAVVTGTSSGIGESIARALLAEDWSVCGMSRRSVSIESEHYHHISADLTDTSAVTQAAKSVIERYGAIDALINNAGVGHFGPHEELSVAQLAQLVHLNLLAPIILTKHLLRSLKETEGALINISSFSAQESSSHGAAYAATKAGLRHFGDSLFDEVRKSGVRVTTITPDITRTPFYDQLSFAPEEDEMAAVTPQCIADAVLQVLSQRRGTVTTQMTIRPQRILLKKRPRNTGAA